MYLHTSNRDSQIDEELQAPSSFEWSSQSETDNHLEIIQLLIRLDAILSSLFRTNTEAAKKIHSSIQTVLTEAEKANDDTFFVEQVFRWLLRKVAGLPEDELKKDLELVVDGLRNLLL